MLLILILSVLLNINRLYPVIPGNARVITDRNITVGGYVIPKKVGVFIIAQNTHSK